MDKNEGDLASLHPLWNFLKPEVQRSLIGKRIKAKKFPGLDRMRERMKQALAIREDTILMDALRKDRNANFK